MINKKGQGMSTSTIILLVLGLIVLVVLSLGFYMGWQKFGNILQSSNVDDIVTECATSCSMNSKYDFCTATKELVDADKNKVKTSCLVFATEPSMKDYGVANCPTITCDKTCESIKIDDKSGSLVADTTLSTYDVSSIAMDISTGQKCAI